MRKLAMSILGVILLVPVFYLNLVYVYYHVQKEAITRNYCVNLPLEDVPTCLGKCYITDLVEQSGEQQESSHIPVVEDKTTNFHVVALDLAVLSSIDELVQVMFIPHELHSCSPSFAHSIFHPPRT